MVAFELCRKSQRIVVSGLRGDLFDGQLRIVQKQVYGQTHPQAVMMLLGVNAIRFHKFDMVTRARRLILDLNSESGEFSKENQERLNISLPSSKKTASILRWIFRQAA